MATLAAPQPMKAIFTSAMSRPTTLRALMRPARVTQAVPCWSSCQMGISHSSRSVSRMRKHLGWAMSSRFTPPRPGLHQLDELDELVGVFGVDHQGKAVDPAEVLVEQRLALHHRQAGLGADVAHAQHAGAVGDDRHRVPLVGVLVGLLGVGLDLEAGLGDARRVPDGEVLEVAHAALERGLDLAAVEGVELDGVFHGLVRLGLELLDRRLMLWIGQRHPPCGPCAGRAAAGDACGGRMAGDFSPMPPSAAAAIPRLT